MTEELLEATGAADVKLRDTYAVTTGLNYRLRAAGALLGVSDNTLRTYSDTSGLAIKRASDDNPASPAIRLFDLPTIFQLAAWRRASGLFKGPAVSADPVVICIDVIKGGTGKSTTTAELGIHLQLMGLRVLLIDLDIQANLTQMYGYEADLTSSEAESYRLTQDAIITGTFASLMLPFIERSRGHASPRWPENASFIKRPFGDAGPALIPADTFLGDLEQAIAQAKGPRELFFQKLLEASKNGEVPGFDVRQFDVVLFDCPPSISFCSTNALAACDFVVSPIKMDSFSVKGLSKLVSELNMLNQAYKLKPELVILPTHYAPNLARIGRMQTQLNNYKDYLAPSSISVSEEFPKGLEAYLPLALQKPTVSATKEYRVFAEYMYAKIVKHGAAK